MDVGVHGVVILHELLLVVLGEQHVGPGGAEVGFHRFLTRLMGSPFWLGIWC